MKILQKPVKLKRHSRVNISFSRPATVYLMTEVQFKRYKEGSSFKRLGGHFDKSPAEFVAPYDGTWHAVIEKGGHFNPEPITGSVEVLDPLMKDIEMAGGSWDEEDETTAVSEPEKEEEVDSEDDEVKAQEESDDDSVNHENDDDDENEKN